MSSCGDPAVTFVYADWVALYPTFALVTEPVATGYFDIATIYCANRLGIIRSVKILTTLLYLLTAHIAWIMSPRNAAGQPDSGGSQTTGIVGRISGATEGSVSVQTENLYPAGTAQWYQQSEWGSTYWAATAVYRTFRYRSPVRQVLGFNQQPWQYPNN